MDTVECWQLDSSTAEEPVSQQPTTGKLQNWLDGADGPGAWGHPGTGEAITGLALTLAMIVRLPRVGVPYAYSSRMNHAWQICYP